MMHIYAEQCSGECVHTALYNILSQNSSLVYVTHDIIKINEIKRVPITTANLQLVVANPKSDLDSVASSHSTISYESITASYQYNVIVTFSDNNHLL